MRNVVMVLARMRVLASAALLGLCFGPSARAGLVLDVSSASNANVEFTGSGTGATFVFNNNGSGQGLQVTASNGVGDSVGLFGTLDGSYSYTTASIVTIGPEQIAPVTSSGGMLTITDTSSISLTGTVNMIDVATIGTLGSGNTAGLVNLSNVVYTGTNADLTQLKNDAALNGGVVTISFQFVPALSLTQLAASGADNAVAWSGSIASVIPEPSSLVLSCISLVGLIGYGLRRHMSLRAGAHRSRFD